MSNFAINDAGDVLEFDGQQWKPARMAANDKGEKVFFDGTAWKPVGGTAGATKGRADAGNKSDATAQAFGQGVTMGFGDELTAGVRAAAPGFSNWMMSGPALQRDESIGGSPTPQTVSTAPTMQGRYDEELARERGKAQQFQKDSPVLATGANVAGNIAGTAALSMLPGARALMSGAGGVPMRVAKGAIAGGTLGGIQGFAEGEGEDQRLKNIMPGAAVGGVVGGALPIAGAGLGYAYEKAAPWALNKVAGLAEKLTTKSAPRSLSAAAPEGGGVVNDSLAASLADSSRGVASNIEQNSAVNRLALEMARSGGVDKARGRLGELGDSAFIADTSKGAQRLANVGNIMPGEAGDKYAAAFGQRNRETGQRFLGAMGDNAKVPQVRDAEQFMEVYKSAKGSEIFDPVLRGDAKLRVSGEMQDLMSTPLVKDAIETVKGFYASANKTPTAAELAHGVKQALYANAQAAERGGKPISPQIVAEIDGRWREALHKANPAIKAADEAYGPIASLPDWFNRGRSFAKQGLSEAATDVSPAALAADLPGATGQQVATLRAGAANTMRDEAMSGPDATRRLAKSLTDNEIKAQKLREIFVPADADRMIRQSGTERVFADTAKEVLGGPQTAQRMASLADEAALSIPQGGGSPISIIQMLANQYAKMRQPNEAVRSRLADMLANPDAATNAETLSLVEAILKQQARARPFQPGISGAAGGYVSDR